MAGIENLKLCAVAAVVLTTSPYAFKVVGPAWAQQLKDDTKLTAVREPVALYIRLCLWSEQRPAACREVPLTPGAAGPGFTSMRACLDGVSRPDQYSVHRDGR
jgi:hypothetical protein